jgi:site-specific recombinase XerD
MRLHVHGKGSRDRSIPVQPVREKIIDTYLASCRRRFPRERLGRLTPQLRDRAGEPIGRRALEYLTGGRACTIEFRSGQSACPAGHLRHQAGRGRATASEIMTLLGYASLATSQN